MCGFAGALGFGNGLQRTGWQSVLTSMGRAIAHRGPDDSGLWMDADAGVGLVHRRLSILDLSPAGHQPMTSPSGRYVIAFNGEIYNHHVLRGELEGVVPEWRGHSDTETLLAALSTWGVEKTLLRCVGMFAFAAWDRERRELILARDRLGEKPLYYGWQGQAFLFGSELKALKAHPAFTGVIAREALTLFLRHSSVPAPYSIFQGIHKLPPGTWLTINERDKDAQPVHYWSMRKVADQGLLNPFGGNEDEAIAELDQLLRHSVAEEMVADVPLGAFLSGGVDSSTVVALMQAQSPRPVRTFSIGFNEDEFNEAEYAKAVARHLGTDHTEMYVAPEDALSLIPRIPAIYDEPFSDSSQIPTFLVAQMARQHVTVSLSGDGGDELFGGYSRYFTAMARWDQFQRLPAALRSGLAQMVRGVPEPMLSAMMALLQFPFQLSGHEGPTAQKVKLAAQILNEDRFEIFYRHFVSHEKQPSRLVIDGDEPSTAFSRETSILDRLGRLEKMMLLDTLIYLPDDILTKIDRAAMAVSLETRIPLLDHRIVEFAWRLPLAMKLRNGQGKWILRQVLYKYVPKALIERPKMGFGVPIGAWLRGPLRDWAEAQLSEGRLRGEGFFHPEQIRTKWKEHLAGQHDWHYYLWDVLMFQAWWEHQNQSSEHC